MTRAEILKLGMVMDELRGIDHVLGPIKTLTCDADKNTLAENMLLLTLGHVLMSLPVARRMVESLLEGAEHGVD